MNRNAAAAVQSAAAAGPSGSGVSAASDGKEAAEKKRRPKYRRRKPDDPRYAVARSLKSCYCTFMTIAAERCPWITAITYPRDCRIVVIESDKSGRQERAADAILEDVLEPETGEREINLSWWATRPPRSPFL